MVEAGVHPRGKARDTKSTAEQKLHEALRGALASLPGWISWHSFRIRSERAREGEADFLLWIPGRGILLLEVKGGRVEVRDGHWLQNGKPMPSPKEQVFEFRRRFVGRLREIGYADPPYIGLAVVFPDTPFTLPPTEDGLRGLVIGAHELGHLADALRAIVDREFPHATED